MIEYYHFRNELGLYSIFAEDVLKFIKLLKLMEGTSNVRTHDAKVELRKHLYNRIVKLNPSENLLTRKDINRICNDIYKRLLEKEYLIEIIPDINDTELIIRHVKTNL